MRLLLLGESAASARYLLGVFAKAQIDVHHVEAGQRLEHLDAGFDVAFFSDYPAARLGQAAASQIVDTVRAGAGLVMIGGWTSFNGMGNGYRDTLVGELLPVVCAPADDRRNVPTGVWFEAVAPQHPVLRGLDLQAPPVLCGFNEVSLAGPGELVARARRLEFNGGAPRAGAAVPLLATGAAGQGRAVAYMSDLVPHWCGGIVDWGTERLQLSNGAEIGDGYYTFLTNMVRWAAGDKAD